MTTQEFSDTFDTLLNSYNTQFQFGEQASKREIVLDEYEKSVLLTQAQDIIVKSYFDGSLNQQGQGFDDSTRRQTDFSSLIKIAKLKPYTPEDSEDSESLEDTDSLFDSRGVLFKMPESIGTNDTDAEGKSATDVLFILNEKLIHNVKVIILPIPSKPHNEDTRKEYTIVPISYREYDREMCKPYAQPMKKQAWRLFQNQVNEFDVVFEVIPREGIKEYTDTISLPNGTKTYESTLIYKIRYVKRPTPIVLEDLPNGLNIDGVSKETQCELHPSLHVDILNKAVELAIATRGTAPSQQNQNETNRQ